MNFCRSDYNQQIDLLKTVREKTDGLNQKEWFSIEIKRLELERDDKLTPEIEAFFTGAQNLLRNHLDYESGYSYTEQKTKFCKEHNINF